VGRTDIAHRLRSNQIECAQIDPNGLCNLHCWYCPVGHYKHPAKGLPQMSGQLFDRVLNNLSLERGRLVSLAFRKLYTAHYNEIFLYDDLYQMFKTLMNHNMKTVLLSNGTNMSPAITRMIVENRAAMAGLGLTVPSVEEGEWRVLTGGTVQEFYNLIHNLTFAYSYIPGSVNLNMLGAKSLQTAQEMFPNWAVNRVSELVDRAGLLVPYGIDNSSIIAERRKDKTHIINCSNGNSRMYRWCNVTQEGNLFLCCDDFNMEYQFGSLATSTLRELWFSDEHIDMIERATSSDGICSRCQHAVWE